MRLLLAPIAVVVLGCAYVGQSASPAPTGPPTAIPTAAPTAAPTAEPGESPTAVPTDEPEVSEVPPEGLLAADGDPVAGKLGSFCWGNTCADGPGPPKDQLPLLDVAAGSELTLTLADGTQFAGWSASYSFKSNGVITQLGSGGDPYGNDPSAAPMTSASFPAPPAGDWAIHVFVGFGDGDASYGWHVIVN